MSRHEVSEVTQDQTTDQRIVDVRTRSALLTIHTYCAHQDCPGREITIRIKDRDDQLLSLLRAAVMRCPVCARPLKCHDVKTAAEQSLDDEREARANVNVQLYRRDHGPVIPADVLLDERLPGQNDQAVAETGF